MSMFVFITEILWQTFWPNNWQFVFDVVKRLRSRYLLNDLKQPLQQQLWEKLRNMTLNCTLCMWVNVNFQNHKYSRVWSKYTPTLTNLLTFLQGLQPYSGLHCSYLSSIGIMYVWGYANPFCQFSRVLSVFIQGGTFIPDFRVNKRAIIISFLEKLPYENHYIFKKWYSR